MLINVPEADQRTEVGNDGRAPEDGNMDCVPESLACMARGLEPGLKVTGDGLHDIVYGQATLACRTRRGSWTVCARSGSCWRRLVARPMNGSGPQWRRCKLGIQCCSRFRATGRRAADVEIRTHGGGL
jgi:hypothetical protein